MVTDYYTSKSLRFRRVKNSLIKIREKNADEESLRCV